MRFGRQSLVVDTDLVATDVEYPQIPDDTHKHLKVMYDDDLLSLADYNEAVEFEDDDALSVDDGKGARGYDDEID